jgi:hypothetical protein
VVTVRVWKPACWSRLSFCGEAVVAVVLVLEHPVTKVKVATAHRILVSVNSFFIGLFGLIAGFVFNFRSR